MAYGKWISLALVQRRGTVSIQVMPRHHLDQRSCRAWTLMLPSVDAALQAAINKRTKTIGWQTVADGGFGEITARIT